MPKIKIANLPLNNPAIQSVAIQNFLVPENEIPSAFLIDFKRTISILGKNYEEWEKYMSAKKIPHQTDEDVIKYALKFAFLTDLFRPYDQETGKSLRDTIEAGQTNVSEIVDTFYTQLEQSYHQAATSLATEILMFGLSPNHYGLRQATDTSALDPLSKNKISGFNNLYIKDGILYFDVLICYDKALTPTKPGVSPFNFSAYNLVLLSNKLTEQGFLRESLEYVGCPLFCHLMEAAIEYDQEKIEQILSSGISYTFEEKTPFLEDLSQFLQNVKRQLLLNGFSKTSLYELTKYGNEIDGQLKKEKAKKTPMVLHKNTIFTRRRQRSLSSPPFFLSPTSPGIN